MDYANFLLLFKVFGALFIISVVYLVSNIFIKQKGENRKPLKTVAVLLAISSFIAMLVVVISNAKQDPRVLSGNADQVYNNDIYNIIFYSLTFLLRATIFGIMVGLFVYLLKKSKLHPSKPVFYLHKFLLVLGIIGILIVFVYDIQLSVVDRKYAEVISFGKYGIIFIGSMFWMMLCSVLAAAALPEEKKNF